MGVRGRSRLLLVSLMNKAILLFLGFALLILQASTSTRHPAPRVGWQRTFGGQLDDVIQSAAQTKEGGYILGGRSASAAGGGKSSPNFGQDDFWIIRVDEEGNKVWERSFGGTGFDELRVIQQTADGGFVAGGVSESPPSGNKESDHFGGGDFWVVRLDGEGRKIWEGSYGGSGNDVMTCLAPTADGGFLLGGYSDSPPGPAKRALTKGSHDFWIVRIDADGKRLWEKGFGGSGEDRLMAMAPAANGGFLLGGSSDSGAAGESGSRAFGKTDYWLVRVDVGGNQLWERTFGGKGNDELLALSRADEGGFVLGGVSDSSVEERKSSLGRRGSDFWIVRVDAGGNKLWEGSHGGQGNEGSARAMSIQQTPDGGFMVGGGTSSRGIHGSKSSVDFGGGDGWVVRLDRTGGKIWDQCFGNAGFDTIYAVSPSMDAGFLLSGTSDSASGGNKISPNFGGKDGWVVKLMPEMKRP